MYQILPVTFKFVMYCFKKAVVVNYKGQSIRGVENSFLCYEILFLNLTLL